MTTRRRQPRITVGVKRSKENGVRRYTWTCPWCLDRWSTTDERRLLRGAVSHLNRHLRAAAATKPEEVEA